MSRTLEIYCPSPVPSRPSPVQVQVQVQSQHCLNLYPGYSLLTCTPSFLKYDWLKNHNKVAATFILENIFIFSRIVI